MGAPVLDTASSKISTSPRRGAHFFEDVRFVEAKCVFLNMFCLSFLFRVLEVWVSPKKERHARGKQLIVECSNKSVRNAC